MRPRSLVALCISLIVSTLGISQGVGVNTTGNNPDPSAILDVTSSEKGVLFPRMSIAQRNAIQSPAKGLMIYNTDCDNLNYNAGTSGAPNWVALNPAITVPAAPSSGTHVPSSTQIIWNWNVVSGAAGYKWHTSNNYSGATDNGQGTNYTQTGLICNTSNTLYVWAYSECGNSSPVTLTQSTSACPWVCGNQLTVTHTAGAVAPITKTVTYGTVSTAISGSGTKCWITQNLGADQQAPSVNDATLQSAGWNWQFGLAQGYNHDGTTRTPNTSWLSSINNNNMDWPPASDPCTALLGSGWRLPTNAEWAAIEGPINNSADAFATVLKLHNSGYLSNTDGNTNPSRGGNGTFYSSTRGSGTGDGKYIEYNSGSSGMYDYDGAYAHALRCLKD
jgi:hypothetical protein